jgi:hypothetical protein
LPLTYFCQKKLEPKLDWLASYFFLIVKVITSTMVFSLCFALYRSLDSKIVLKYDPFANLYCQCCRLAPTFRFNLGGEPGPHQTILDFVSPNLLQWSSLPNLTVFTGNTEGEVSSVGRFRAAQAFHAWDEAHALTVLIYLLDGEAGDWYLACKATHGADVESWTVDDWLSRLELHFQVTDQQFSHDMVGLATVKPLPNDDVATFTNRFRGYFI